MNFKNIWHKNRKERNKKWQKNKKEKKEKMNLENNN
jgi:hypothetical protein